MEAAQRENISVAQAKPRWRPRFSLATLLISVVAAGALMGLIKFRSELVDEREKRVFAEDMLKGTLEQQEEHNRHFSVVIKSGNRAEGKWSWLVAVPKGMKWTLKYQFVPNDYKNRNGYYRNLAGDIGEGRTELDIQFANEYLTFDANGTTSNFRNSGNVLDFETFSGAEIQQVGSDKAFSANDLPKTVELLTSPENKPGLRVWLEPKK